MLLSTAALGLLTVSSAQAADVEKSMAWSGFVNRNILMGDDGVGNFVTHADPNGVAGTRARVKGQVKSDAMTIGAYIELGLTNGGSGTATGTSTGTPAIRHSMIHASNAMGKISMGQTAHASEAMGGFDASGTSLATSYSASPFNSVLFKDTSTGAGVAATGASVATAHGGGYTEGRLNGISYTSPKFNGFTGMISHRTDASGSYMVKYGGDFNGVKVTAGYSYANVGTTGVETAATESISGGGVTLTLPGGLNLSTNYREEEKNSLNTAPDGNTWMNKVGYTMSGLSDLGKTNVAVLYKKAEDANAIGDDYENISLLFTQALSDYGTTVYGGYSNLSYDTADSNFDDINGFFMGAVVTF
jgi:hypothetical protein